MNWMNTLIASTLVACSLSPIASYCAPTEVPSDFSQKAKPATIKVLVSRQKDEVLLETKGRCFVYDAIGGFEVGNASNKRAFVKYSESGIKWHESFPGISQIRLVPADAQSTLLVDGIEYRGCVEIYAVKGKLVVINEVDVERYLKSVLSTQFPNELDDDVMDAIAIVARTNAYYLISHQTGAHWNVDAQEVGYQGHALTLQNIHVDRAINNTRYMVLTYKDTPFAATWTKDSAGHTAEFSSIFRKDALTPRAVETPFAAKDREKHSWSFTMTKQELAKALGVDRVVSLDAYQDKDSQKIYAVRIKDSKDFQSIDFFRLQKAIGANRLRSNDFTTQLNGEQIVFKGYGEGHGVGLCLYSANVMAEKGEATPKILSTFFPGTKLKNARTVSDIQNEKIADVEKEEVAETR